MTLEAIYTYLAEKPGTTEGFPFGPQVLVFKVMGKIFAFLAPDKLPPEISLKCDPEEAIALRERYAAIRPGYHLNKQHWNTVTLDGSVPPERLRQMIDASYALIAANLKKADRETLANL